MSNAGRDGDEEWKGLGLRCVVSPGSVGFREDPLRLSFETAFIYLFKFQLTCNIVLTAGVRRGGWALTYCAKG